MVYRTKRRVSKRAKRPMMKSTRRKYSSRSPRYPKPDGNYSEKVVISVDMIVNTNKADLIVNWNTWGTVGSNPISKYFFDSTT